MVITSQTHSLLLIAYVVHGLKTAKNTGVVPSIPKLKVPKCIAEPDSGFTELNPDVRG